MKLIYKIIFGFLLYNIVRAKAEELKRLFPAYAIAFNADILSDSTCKSDLEKFQNAVDKKILWGLKILDASGRPSSGFVYGNNYWLGSKSQCLDLENTKPLELDPEFLKNFTKYRNIDEEFPPFHLNYFNAHFYHNSTVQYQLRFKNEDLISLGLCLPASCSTDELGKILNKIFQAKTLAVGNLYSADYRLHSIRSIKDNYQWLFDWKIITTGSILILTVILVIIGTLYDCIVHQKRLELIKNSKNIADNRGLISTNKMQPNLFGQILLCFSAYTNTLTIFETKVNIKDVMPSIFGLRFLGLLYVCLIHTFIYPLDLMDNRVTMWRLSEGLASQILTNSHFSVDTFFCLSGFLLSWSFFGKRVNNHRESKSIRSFPWIKYISLIFKRVIRFGPVYYLTIGITEIIFGWYNTNSSFILPEDPYHRCNDYWWRNVLFINNLYPWNEICVSWTWFMSNDMQFHIVGTFLLLLSDIHFYTSAFCLMSLIIFLAIINGFIFYAQRCTSTLDQLFLLMDVGYLPPWMRISPYLIGMIAGYILIKLNGKLDLGRKTLCLLWIIGSSCNIFALFGLYGRNISPISTAIYFAVCRILWGIGIAWILIACNTNNAGVINKILSLKIWIPLSKLSYCAYMLNPLITLSLPMASETPIHLDIFPSVIYFFGLTTVTLLIAFIASVLIEIPYILLFHLISKSRKKEQ